MALNDYQRVKRLGRYLRQDKKSLLIILLILAPVALAGAIQPLLVGQAISVLRGEATFAFLNDLPLRSAIRLLIGVLLVELMGRI